MKTYVYTKTHSWMFITALFVIANSWKQPKCPSVSEWLNTGISVQWNITWQWKGTNCWYMQQLGQVIRSILLSEKDPFSKGHVLYESIYMIFLRRRQWHPISVLLPGKSHGQRSLVCCSPWGHWELDMTQWLHFHFSLSCIGGGNGTHSSVLAWRIPGTGEPGGLPSMGLHRVGQDWSDLAAAAACRLLGQSAPE